MWDRGMEPSGARNKRTMAWGAAVMAGGASAVRPSGGAHIPACEHAGELT